MSLTDRPSLYITSLRSFDLNLLTECDDEYWESGFEQPPGKPSTISYFNSYLHLMDIMACAMRLIVSCLNLAHQVQTNYYLLSPHSTPLNGPKIYSIKHLPARTSK